VISTEVLGCRAEFRFDDERLEAALAYLVHGAPAVVQTRKTIRYEVLGDGPYELREDGDVVRELALPEDVLHVIYTRLHRRAIERFVLSGWSVYHAAVATVGSRRLMMLGNSGVGKSTLSLRLMLAGHEVEGDELALERCGVVVALPRAFHVKEGIERHVPELASLFDSLPRMIEGNVRALEPSRLGLAWSAKLGAVDDVIWIDHNHGAETTLERRPPVRAIRRLIRAAPGWGEDRATLIASASRLGRGGGHRLLLGEPHAGVACLEGLAATESA